MLYSLSYLLLVVLTDPTHHRQKVQGFFCAIYDNNMESPKMYLQRAEGRKTLGPGLNPHTDVMLVASDLIRSTLLLARWWPLSPLLPVLTMILQPGFVSFKCATWVDADMSWCTVCSVLEICLSLLAPP